MYLRKDHITVNYASLNTQTQDSIGGNFLQYVAWFVSEQPEKLKISPKMVVQCRWYSRIRR